MAASIERKLDRADTYNGDKWRYLRNGHGVYKYANKFYQYEGEWRNGKKHGHGKLIMADGTYYEGEFVNGEINGNGFKHFASSENEYTGQFEKGELQGNGVMCYKDGTSYEGQFCHNRKEGHGKMKNLIGVYEGDFYNNKKHGVGSFSYYCGDKYEGDWVLDTKQGHGNQNYNDGTRYEGQWFDDKYHGQGLMVHTSGMIYEGLWLNGLPEKLATKIVILEEQSPLVITQGVPFTVKVECRNDDDEVIEDQGRTLRICVGFKYQVPKQGSALFDMIEDVEEKPVPTPFGYEVVSYPLTDILPQDGIVQDDSKEDEPEEEVSQSESRINNDDEVDGTDGKDPQVEQTAASQEGENVEEQSTKEVEKESNVVDTAEETPAEIKLEDTDVSPQNDSIPLPPPVADHSTENGVTEWCDLQLAPPPPMYRPFELLEEEAALKRSKSNVRRKSSELTENVSRSSSFIREQSDMKEDNFARIGEYVLMVHDVTSPPFLERTLESAFLLLKLQKAPKARKPKEHKPKWDTQRHIAQAMHKQGTIPEI